MTRDDLRIFCTALGFTAVILNDVEKDEQAFRAKAIGRLIESFCFEAIPDAFNFSNQNIGEDSAPAEIDMAIEKFKTKLQNEGAARLPDDRETLLKYYDRLCQRRQRRLEQHFYATGSEDIIANRVLQLIDEEISEAKPDA